MAYSEKVIEHYEKPRNVGSLDNRSNRVGTGLVGAPECGDVMKLQIEVDDNNKIIDAKFKTFGCGSAIAASSLATEWIKDKTIDEASMINNTEIVEELSLPPVKIHCSVLAEDAIKAAIKDYQSKQLNIQKRNIVVEVKVVEERMIERWKRLKKYSKKLVRGVPRHQYNTSEE